jgi:hypothetical protein
MHLYKNLVRVVEVVYYIAHVAHLVTVDEYRACVYNFADVAEFYIILLSGAENVYSFEEVDEQIDGQDGNDTEHSNP